jgi:hypothetical protein
MTKEVRVIMLTALVVTAICLGLIVFRMGRQQPQEQTKRPEIEELFACGDNCPGPQSRYMKKVYSGVEDEEMCRRVGGVWNSFTGWGTTYYCEVK